MAFAFFFRFDGDGVLDDPRISVSSRCRSRRSRSSLWHATVAAIGGSSSLSAKSTPGNSIPSGTTTSRSVNESSTGSRNDPNSASRRSSRNAKLASPLFSGSAKTMSIVVDVTLATNGAAGLSGRADVVRTSLDDMLNLLHPLAFWHATRARTDTPGSRLWIFSLKLAWMSIILTFAACASPSAFFPLRMLSSLMSSCMRRRCSLLASAISLSLV